MHEIVEVRYSVEIRNQFFKSSLGAQRCLMMLGYQLLAKGVVFA